jgi:hypothetical protein
MIFGAWTFKAGNGESGKARRGPYTTLREIPPFRSADRLEGAGQFSTGLPGNGHFSLALQSVANVELCKG